MRCLHLIYWVYPFFHLASCLRSFIICFLNTTLFRALHYGGQCKHTQFTCYIGVETYTQIFRIKGFWGQMSPQWPRYNVLEKADKPVIFSSLVNEVSIVKVSVEEMAFEWVSRRGRVLICGREFQLAGPLKTSSWKRVYSLGLETRAVAWSSGRESLRKIG